jgi:outer membrane protein OmpA-like peptidoglycan-associated protein
MMNNSLSGLFDAPAGLIQRLLDAPVRVARRNRQRGAAVVELAVVAPILTIMGLGTVQYSQLFFAKNQLDHAAMLAARAGSVGNAKLDAIKNAYTEGLVPMFGGGETAAKLADSLAAAKVSVEANAAIEMLNPTKEAFQDFNDPALQTLLDIQGKRVISNRGLAFKPNSVGPTSGETLQDANLIKLRITHGIKPVVPIISSIYKVYLKWQDTGTDPLQTRLINDGLVPVVTHVTLQMQSDAIEPDSPVSAPGAGNGGNPVNPGDPPVTTNPPPPVDDCINQGGCGTQPQPPGNTCPIPIVANLNADALFGFDQAALQPAGMEALDQLIRNTNGRAYDTLTVTGYTDPIGTEVYNLDLSRRRAEAVRDYLISHGLRVDYLNVVGAGSADLVVRQESCPGMTGVALQNCYAPNRRVVVELTPKGSP